MRSSFKNDFDIIILGSKTRLSNCLVEVLKRNKLKNKTYSLNTFINSLDIKVDLKKIKTSNKLVLFLLVSGGVRTKNHSGKNALNQLNHDIELCEKLNKRWEHIHIIFISSVLALSKPNKNSNYAFCKIKAEYIVRNKIMTLNNINSLSIIYPGRLSDSFLKNFFLLTTSYKRLSEFLFIITLNHQISKSYLIGLDAIVLAIIKCPIVLKDLSLRILFTSFLSRII